MAARMHPDHLDHREILQQARSVLSQIRRHGQDALLRAPQQAAQALACCILLIHSFQRRLAAGAGPLPSSPDWVVARAVLELVVRWGISPNLDPGVGVPRQKLSENSAVLATASAMSEHLSALAASGSLRLSSVEQSLAAETGVLLICAEVVASIALDASCKQLQDAVSPVSDESIRHQQRAVSPLGQLILDSYLSDIMAAYLQLAYGPQSPDFKVAGKDKNLASRRVQEIVTRMPVGQVVESCLILLNQSSPEPPAWLKREVGKQLSRLVMREGGVAAVLERLVGGAVKGNVKLYEKIAGHLAKIPMSVANAKDYFETACPQLLSLLLLDASQTKPTESETAHQNLCNIHATALIMACNMVIGEPELAEKYLLGNLMRPFLTWRLSQAKINTAEGSSGSGYKAERCNGYDGSVKEVRESELLDSLVQMRLLITAGHKGSSSVRKFVLSKSKHIAPLLLKLHHCLEAYDSNGSFSRGGNKAKVKNSSDQLKLIPDAGHCSRTSSHKAVEKGFPKGLKGMSGAPENHWSILGTFRAAVTDIAFALAMQPTELSLPVIYSYLFDASSGVLKWPQEEGEILDALTSCEVQSYGAAKYISRLLITTENWSLAVALMGELLRKVLNIKRLVPEIVGEESVLAENLLSLMQTFEVLNTEVGTKALEKDTVGASLLVKALLDDKSVLADEGMLELVLHMVYSMLCGIHMPSEDDKDAKDSSDEKKFAVLTAIMQSLKKIHSTENLSENVKRMSSTLIDNISVFLSS